MCVLNVPLSTPITHHSIRKSDWSTYLVREVVFASGYLILKFIDDDLRISLSFKSTVGALHFWFDRLRVERLLH